MSHQGVVGTLLYLLTGALRQSEVGRVFPGGDVRFGPDSLVIPDLLVVDMESVQHDDWSRINTPLLVVEVLSPSSTRQDRFTKRRLYQEMGIHQYWLVDASARTVEVWTPEATFPTTERARVTWHPVGAAEPLVIELAELFPEQ
jgi:Uma2 family endonuclease